jgi:hypothetical protein
MEQGYMSGAWKWFFKANRFAISSSLPVQNRLAGATEAIGVVKDYEMPTAALQGRFKKFKKAVTSGVASDGEAESLLAEMFDIFSDISTHKLEDAETEADGPIII